MFARGRNIKVDVPKEFTKEVIDIIGRIEQNTTVCGVMFIKNDTTVMYTVPQGVEMILSKKLPQLSKAVKQAILEIDILTEVSAYRIMTKKGEISVALGDEFAAVTVAGNTRNKVLWPSADTGHH